MSAYARTVDAAPSEVLERAVAYFGHGGIGLEAHEVADDHATFFGGGGHVEVQVCQNDGKTEIDLDTREWDRQVLDFLRDF